jgi:hypothetical protein
LIKQFQFTDDVDRSNQLHEHGEESGTHRFAQFQAGLAGIMTLHKAVELEPITGGLLALN